MRLIEKVSVKVGVINFSFDENVKWINTNILKKNLSNRWSRFLISGKSKKVGGAKFSFHKNLSWTMAIILKKKSFESVKPFSTYAINRKSGRKSRRDEFFFR